MFGHKAAKLVEHRARLERKIIAAGGNAHVAFGQRVIFQARQGPKHCHIRIFLNNLAQQGLVPCRAHLIEHHARKLQPRLKGCHAMHQCRCRARHLCAVDAEDDGAAKHTRQLRCGA